MAGWDATRIESLKELFLKHGEVHQKAEKKDHLEHDDELPPGLELPTCLKALLRTCAKWNFTKESCDVFNCNMFLMSPKDDCIFGDGACREDWKKECAKEVGGESCAGPDWACIAASSEYDFYFVNLRKDSPLFGTTRHIVNNTREEEVFTEAPFEKFLDVVEAYAKANADKKPEESEDEADIEYDCFSNFKPSKRARKE
eukprot:TRINITY_DN18227_c0_g1_i1.p1 TRINITY_DN18227_c0_g1~~TRINITY_DN18227_c0_g1_i1.p1  ORF type:complete len:200 (+),score=42.07 TRINITY_DN18227_c0_g1_i1:100-699(+)